MFLDYARPRTARGDRQVALAVMTAALALGCAAVTGWCMVHVADRFTEPDGQRGQMCVIGNEDVAARRMPLESAVSAAVLSGGCAFAAAVQAIRLTYALRDRGGA